MDITLGIPDEVAALVDVPAKERFAKYRGLKSFRTSSWDPKESLLPEYARIFVFDNFTRTQKHVLAKIAELNGVTKDCAQVGSYMRLYVKNVPLISRPNFVIYQGQYLWLFLVFFNMSQKCAFSLQHKET
ncbi:hypothetical protein PAHAL_4G241100 [Panicum hallii]|uniref:Ribosome biogenesis protein BMS1/TSR1 C-terminal domain-containing protein n=1 Tax=Panicum hallii TaxID=206008 RepID=A0A2T8JDV3_9POAL|nr:hypothetical protein PAHAL_4G241100 [Panicum hallii]